MTTWQWIPATHTFVVVDTPIFGGRFYNGALIRNFNAMTDCKTNTVSAGGFLVDAQNGMPIVGAEICLVDAMNRGGLACKKTDAKGAFSFVNVRLQGNMAVMAAFNGDFNHQPTWSQPVATDQSCVNR